MVVHQTARGMHFDHMHELLLAPMVKGLVCVIKDLAEVGSKRHLSYAIQNLVMLSIGSARHRVKSNLRHPSKWGMSKAVRT